MYAIRSYYGHQLFELLIHGQEIVDDVLCRPIHIKAMGQLRITSYNVCYTKLLRTAPPLSGNHPLMEKMRLHDWVVSLQEEEQVGLKGELARLHQTGCSFLVPLRFDQSLEGFVALGRRIYQQERLTYEDFDMMKILAHQAVGMLLSYKLYSQLARNNFV